MSIRAFRSSSASRSPSVTWRCCTAATIGDDTLIGMGAMVMNGATVGKGCVIGANALVTEGKDIPDGSMVLGAPGKIVKTLDEATQQTLMRGAEAYKARQKQYRKGLQPLS